MKLGLAMMVTVSLLLGCIDSEETFTINPDGTGNVVVRWIGAFDAKLLFIEVVNVDEALGLMTRNELVESEGVDCWKDVSWRLLDDGRYEFKGTAYFRDFSKLRLHHMNLNEGWSAFALSRDKEGNLLIEARKSDETPKELTEDDLKKEMRQARYHYQQVRRVSKVFLEDFRCRIRIRLPGEIGNLTAWKRDGDRGAELLLDGPRVLEALDETVKSDEKLREAIRRGWKVCWGLPWDKDEMPDGSLFWAEGWPRLATQGKLAPLFDYDQEVTEEARQAYRALLQQLPVADPLAFTKKKEEKPVALDSLLRKTVSVDVSGPQLIRAGCVVDREAREAMAGAASEQGYRYALLWDGGAETSRGDESGQEFTLKLEGARITHFSMRRSDGSQLSVELGPFGRTIAWIQNPVKLWSALLTRTIAEGHLIIIRGTECVARSWKSFDEALHKHVSEFGEFVGALKSFPVHVEPAFVDPAAIEVALLWDQFPEEKLVARLMQGIEALDAKDVGARESAVMALKKLLTENVALARYFPRIEERISRDPEVQSRVREVLSSVEDIDAIRFAAQRALDHDLSFLGALVESGNPDWRAGARERLEAITGVTFDTRESFDCWYQAVGRKMRWDEQIGRYVKTQ
ncbi:MAG: hypothetical protein HYY16_04475 [Planctomycetes bacterium]|nr:hypothetical protein [Planctomycetota bacterium]